MGRDRVLLLLVAFSTATSFPLAELPERIRAILAASNASWGILIHSSARGQLFSLSANQSFVPASNTKLLMASAAISLLGTEFTFATRAFVGQGGNSTGVCLQPSGDPSFSDEALTSLMKATAALIPRSQRKAATLELALPNTGSIPSSWEFDDLNYAYGAAPQPSILNGNAIDLDVSPGPVAGKPLLVTPTDSRDMHVLVTVADGSFTLPNVSLLEEPPELKYNLDEVSGRLELQLRGSMRIGDSPVRFTRAVQPPARLMQVHLHAAAHAAGLGTADDSVTIASGPGCCSRGNCALRFTEAAANLSKPLLELLNHTLQHSDNTYAEAILRALNQTQPSLDSGLTACRSALQSIGVDLTGVQHVDGSGLSRHNLIPPDTFVSLLRAMAGSPLRHTLPVAGRSGTLRHRFVGTAAEGRVLAKTGTLGGVSALSGYLLHPDPAMGEVTFSLMANNFLGSGATLRPALDAIIVAVTNAVAGKSIAR